METRRHQWSGAADLSPAGTDLSVRRDVDGAVVQPQPEDAVRVGLQQQRERRLAADVLGQQQRTGGWQLTQAAVKRHSKLIRQHQRLV